MRIAIVIPWFGSDLKGGAEQQAWQIANRLHASGIEVEVLTTCSRSFLHSWDRNFYRAGLSYEGRLPIRRFKLRTRNKHKFNHIVGQMLALTPKNLVQGIFPLNRSEEDAYWQNNVGSEDLIKYLRQNQHAYDAFIFLPYLFPTTYEGVMAVGSKAYIQPCLHDEVYAYLRGSVEMMSVCRGLLFNSPGEHSLAVDLYGDWINDKSSIVGEGVEFLAPKSAPIVEGDYFLVLGRRCHEKNTPLAIEAYEKFRAITKSEIKLVIAGPENIPVPFHDPQIIDLGLVSGEAKEVLLRDCVALVNLSVNESFSRVLYESWLAAHAVIINKDCRATFQALEASDAAGLSARTVDDACDAMVQVEQELKSGAWQERGLRGQRYAKPICNWDNVVERYTSIFAEDMKANREDKKTVCLIYSLDFYCQATLTDLKSFKDIFSNQKVVVLSRCAAVTKELGSLCVTSDQVDYRNSNALIWFGHQNWPEVMPLAILHKNKVVLRNVTPRPLDIALTENFSQSLSAWPMFPLQNLQATEGDLDLFFQLDRDAIKLFLLVNWQKNESIERCKRLLDFFSIRYDQKLELLVGICDSSEIANAHALQIPGRIKARAVLLNNADSDLTAYYRLADALLLFDDPEVNPWHVLASKSYFLPLTLIDSPYWQSLINQANISSHEGSEFARPAAAIKIACESINRNESAGAAYSLLPFFPGAIEKSVMGSLKHLVD